MLLSSAADTFAVASEIISVVPVGGASSTRRLLRLRCWPIYILITESMLIYKEEFTAFSLTNWNPKSITWQIMNARKLLLVNYIR